MSDSADILLMVDPVGDQVFPVSPRAFLAISSSRARILARNCVALFLDAAGEVRRIENVSIPGVGMVRRLGLLFGLPVPARFIFDPVEVTLDDFRIMVLDAMSYSRVRAGFESGKWWLNTAPEDDIRAELGRATSLANLHARMRFPADYDCLDQL